MYGDENGSDKTNQALESISGGVVGVVTALASVMLHALSALVTFLINSNI